MIPYLSKGQGNTLTAKMEEKISEKVVYRSDIMKQMLKTVDRVSTTDASILISGRSGSGKEIIAKRIHCKSYRKNRPFVVINCSCLNESTAESELFGHEKGAFTGAHRQKIGLLEKAHGGNPILR